MLRLKNTYNSTTAAVLAAADVVSITLVDADTIHRHTYSYTAAAGDVGKRPLSFLKEKLAADVADAPKVHPWFWEVESTVSSATDDIAIIIGADTDVTGGRSILVTVNAVAQAVVAATHVNTTRGVETVGAAPTTNNQTRDIITGAAVGFGLSKLIG